jgi:hypothetical protein
MAAVAEILDRLQHNGVRLRAEGDRLVAESNSPLTDDTRALIRANKPRLLRELSGDNLIPDQEAAINRWLDHIGETDPALRAECLHRCRQEPEARRYHMERAREVRNDTGGAADAVRARLLHDLEANPDLVRAVEVIDPDADPVRLIVAIRGTGTCELQIDRDRWNPFAFLRLIEARGETH